MRIAIIYATTDGQTRKIARFSLGELFRSGHSVELVQVSDAEDLDLASVDAAVLAASVHIGGFQSEFTDFATRNHVALNALPTLFLPVSLSAAGQDPDDWKGLNQIVATLVQASQWNPGTIQHVAGAFRFREYNLLTSWAMLWIARQKQQKVDRDQDREYTDWAGLAAALASWAGLLSR